MFTFGSFLQGLRARISTITFGLRKTWSSYANAKRHFSDHCANLRNVGEPFTIAEPLLP
jgi:hypothetical protein